MIDRKGKAIEASTKGKASKGKGILSGNKSK